MPEGIRAAARRTSNKKNAHEFDFSLSMLDEEDDRFGGENNGAIDRRVTSLVTRIALAWAS